MGRSGPPRLDQDVVISRMRSIHGDTYDYSKFVYTTLRTKGEIICREHGSFFQNYGNHFFNRSGCPTCVHRRLTLQQIEAQRAPSNKLALDTVVDRMRQAHSTPFDYTAFEYVEMKTPGKISCPTHGPFWMSPNDHVRSKTGCPECTNEHLRAQRAWSLDEVVTRSRAIHGDTYEYPPQVYVNSSTPFTIVCRKHGAFQQCYDSHVHQTAGCPQCFGSFKRTPDEFLDAAKTVHGERYDYSEVKYVNNSTPVKIVCSAHGSFWQKPMKHINVEQGCPRCADNVSKAERKWLAAVGVPDDPDHRQVRIVGSRMRADGMINHMVYEFFGTYWHGDPRTYAPDALNTRNGHRMGSLYLEALEKQRRIIELGYELKYVWELDYRAGQLFSEKNPHEWLTRIPRRRS